MGGDTQTRKGYVDISYLDSLATLLEGVKRRSYEMLHIQPGDSVLDAGCGPGIDTTAIGKIVGAAGRVVGIDTDAEMLAAADERARAEGLADCVSHRLADITDLPFESESFDVCRCERVFQHLSDPEKALDELVRVTRSGGRILLIDPDWSTLSIDTKEVEIEWKLRKAQLWVSHYNPLSGRQFYRMFRQRGMQNIMLEVRSLYFTTLHDLRFVTTMDNVEQRALEANIVSEEDLRCWHADLERSDQAGELYGHILGVVAVAQKP
jgi:ubiquinone/menaquinone biosynthesis C-methylase UbiE